MRWEPLPYMTRAVEFLASHNVGGLPLEPGARKTSITLEAFRRLKEQRVVRNMLVIAPKRVCENVWPNEVAKWDHLSHLTVSVVTGNRRKREAALRANADIYVTNPEEVVWLSEQYKGTGWPFDVVTIDELTKFKNTQAKRFKTLRPLMRQTRVKWGLTGSLTSNGYLDVFGQQLILDDGAALGRYITRYRQQFFQQDYTGFVWTLRIGADKRIADKIAPYWFQIDPAEYAQLPPLVDVVVPLKLDERTAKQYKSMADGYLAAMSDGDTITAANAAAAYVKLSQLANGAVYDTDRDVHHLHDIKLDAIEDLVEELNGTPLLLAYEFQHDLERLRTRLAKTCPGGVLPTLGGGTPSKQEQLWIQQWNAGQLPILCAHPASAGHGLNLQEFGASHVAWFSLPWSWELYDQFIRRIRRSGTTAERIFNHLFMVTDTIDHLKLTALTHKLTTHTEFMRYLLDQQNGSDTMSELPAGWTTPVQMGQQPQAQAPAHQEQRQRISDAVTAFQRPTNGAAPETQPQQMVAPTGWAQPAQQATTHLSDRSPPEQPQQAVQPPFVPDAAAGFAPVTQPATETPKVSRGRKAKATVAATDPDGVTVTVTLTGISMETIRSLLGS